MLQKSPSVATHDFTQDFARFKREEGIPRVEIPLPARNFLQSHLGLEFLSQYNQKSLSILNVYTKTVGRKRGREQKENTRETEQQLYTAIILRLGF